MSKGRRARSVRGSPNSDRPERWGASVIGVCQRASRACCIGCRGSTPCTDRSSFEHWLKRLSYPDLGSGCNHPRSWLNSTATHPPAVPTSGKGGSRPLSSGVLAENARPASHSAASAGAIISSRPSPSGGLRPALTSRLPPRASTTVHAPIRGP